MKQCNCFKYFLKQYKKNNYVSVRKLLLKNFKLLRELKLLKK